MKCGTDRDMGIVANCADAPKAKASVFDEIENIVDQISGAVNLQHAQLDSLNERLVGNGLTTSGEGSGKGSGSRTYHDAVLPRLRLKLLDVFEAVNRSEQEISRLQEIV